jgi:hypothetical protein
MGQSKKKGTGKKYQHIHPGKSQQSEKSQKKGSSYGWFTRPTQYFPVPSGIFGLPSGFFPVPSGVFVLPSGIFPVPSQYFTLPSGVFPLPSGVLAVPTSRHLKKGVRPECLT